MNCDNADARAEPPTNPEHRGRRLAGRVEALCSLESALPPIVIVTVAILLIIALTPFGSATSPDSIRYLEVARSIAAGMGIEYQDSPFTTYPPLYPLALSLFVAPQGQLEDAAANMAILTLSLSGLLLFALLRPAIGRPAATLGTLVFLVSQPVLTVFTYAWSESLAIPLLLFCSWCCLGAISAASALEARKQGVYLILLGAGLVALAYSRYIGVVFSVLLPFAWLSTKHRRKWTARYLVVGSAVAASIGALYIRNHHLTGYYSGAVREPSTSGLVQNIGDALRAFRLQLLDEPLVLLAVLMSAVGVVVLGRFRGRFAPDSQTPTQLAHSRLLTRLSWVCFGTYMGALILIRSRNHLDRIDTRFIAPGFLFLLILLLLGSRDSRNETQRSVLVPARMATALSLTLLIAARGLRAYQHAASSLAFSASPRFPLSVLGPYRNYNSPSAALLARVTLLLEDKQYQQARIELERASMMFPKDFVFNMAMAKSCAGLGSEVESLEYTRLCLEQDYQRTLANIVHISKPFWEDEMLYWKGIRYFEQLKHDVPDAWWIYHNIGQLAERLGKAKLAEESLAMSRSLKESGPPDPNGTPVILIVVDTLRADHLGAYGHERATSPNLDAWFRTGRLFEQAYATSSWTLPSFGSIYTGLLPMRHGAGKAVQVGGSVAWGKLDAGVRTLAEILGQRGYATGAVINNPYLGSAFGTHRGFADYDYDGAAMTEMRRADLVVDRALSWVDSQHERPFFLLVHFFDPHMAYDAPKPFHGKFSREYDSQFSLPIEDVQGIRSGRYELTEGDREFIRAAYDEEIAFVDHELGRFRAGLAARGLLDKALIVFTSDHGEELFEHGGFEHGHAMWQELLHVPFVIWGPGVLPGRELSPVSIVDIAPTILAATNLTPEPGLEGMSLWPHLTTGLAIGDRFLFAEGNLYGEQRKTVIHGPHKVVTDVLGNSIRIADLTSEPVEQEDLSPSEASFADELLQELLKRLGTDRSQPQTATPDAETQARLRSLGYAE